MITSCYVINKMKEYTDPSYRWTVMSIVEHSMPRLAVFTQFVWQKLTMLKEDIKRQPKNALIEDEDESEAESEYTYTDRSESDESNYDYGLGFIGRQKKIDDSLHSSAPLPDFSDEEQKTAEYLAEWIKGVADLDRDIVHHARLLTKVGQIDA